MTKLQELRSDWTDLLGYGFDLQHGRDDLSETEKNLLDTMWAVDKNLRLVFQYFKHKEDIAETYIQLRMKSDRPTDPETDTGIQQTTNPDSSGYNGGACRSR